jgi:hypothetical protein
MILKVECWPGRFAEVRKVVGILLTGFALVGVGALEAEAQEYEPVPQKKTEEADTIRYRAYTPDIERTYVANPETSDLQYNHAGTIVHWREQFWVAWNGNTDTGEGEPGQQIYVSRSMNGVDWSKPTAEFNRAEHSVDPIRFRANKTQWQPVFHVFRDTLVCFWTEKQSDGETVVYASRLGAPEGKWTHEIIEKKLVRGEKTYFPFTAQDPIKLRSGRILLPIVWVAKTKQQIPDVDNVYWRREKRIGALYSDDGKVWEEGYFAGNRSLSPLLWEPFFLEQQDGTVRLFVRRQPGAGQSDRLLLTGIVQQDSILQSLAPVGVQVPASRAGLIQQDGGERYLMLHNDTRPGQFVRDRRNLAIFASRTGSADFVPGTAFTEDETESVVAYPQGIEHNRGLHVVYSEGGSPRGLKVAHITPSPNPAEYYVYPREYSHLYDTPGYEDGAYHFEGGPSVLKTEESTADWEGHRVTTGAMVRLERQAGTILDSRSESGEGNGIVLFGSTDPDEGLTFYHPQIGNVTTGLQLPVREWTYVGVSVAEDMITFVVFPKEGEGRVVRRPIDSSISVKGDEVRLGAPIPISTLPDFEGQIADFLLFASTAWGVQNHLNRARRLRESVVTRSLVKRTNKAVQEGEHLYIDANESPVRESAENVVTSSGEVRLRRRRPRGSATVTTHRSQRALEIQGMGSAGVELPAGIREKSIYTQISFQVWVHRCCGQQVLFTVGDLKNHVSLRMQREIRGAKLRLDYSSLSMPRVLGPIQFGEWTKVSVKIKADEVTIEAGEESWTVSTEKMAPRFLIGKGFVSRETGVSKSNPAARFYVDLESLQSIRRY